MEYAKNWYKKGDALLKEIRQERAAENEVCLWFLGQAGFVIKTGPCIIYVDPILHDYTGGSGEKRLSPPPFPAGAVVDADCFVCTHNHHDHLNLETLLPQARNNSKTLFAVPAPCTGILVEAGISRSRIIAAREGEAINLAGNVSIHPIAAAHSEYLSDNTGADFFLGYIIESNGTRVYHAGDGIVTERLLKTLEKYRPVNIAILPINGMDWERTAHGIIGNMNFQDAAKLARAMDFDVTIPAHYDFLRGNTANPAHFAEVFYELCPEKKFHICALGECFVYRRHQL
ncbi:MAG: MBL fold metallo-hydrolase [Spirochaetaceae bacterium]|jgi:L-ascorbate metabolism protein UlaG (beta-lactamase superfamily)|nr:MBL fold metallo-hydrolase [Spirochaetaceae bacterium]